jgi:hypothetical protein
MELLPVTAVSGTTITVKRGWQSLAKAWPSGQRVWICGADGQLADTEPTGAQTSTTNLYLPLICPKQGSVWNVRNGVWTKVDVDEPTTILTLGTAGTGVTVTERGDDNHHYTTLTFSAIDVSAIAAAAAEAVGVLIYTFPAASVLKINSVYMSVGLTNTDTTIDADTPDLGLGTVIATGAVAVLGGTATFENILTGQTMNNCTGTAEVIALDSSLVILTGAAHTVHLNVADTWAGSDTMLFATGTIVLEWTQLA